MWVLSELESSLRVRGPKTTVYANIQTAAETVQLEASLDPRVLDTTANLQRAMTASTSFDWRGDVNAWAAAAGDDADIIRFERAKSSLA